MQLVLNSVLTGCIYALVGCGFALVYRVQRFFFISHGVSIAASGFLTYWLAQRLNWPFALVIPVVVIAISGLAVLIDSALFARLRARHASALTMFIASTSVFVLGQNLFLLLFGPSVRTLSFQNPIFEVGGGTITYSQTIIILTSICTVLGLSALLRFLPIGTMLRALAESEALARACGLPVDRLHVYTHMLSGALGAIAGIAVAVEMDIRFTAGLVILFKGIIVVILGGIGSTVGALFGGLFLGLVENTAVWFLPTGLKDAAAAVVFIIFLLCRRQGFLVR